MLLFGIHGRYCLLLKPLLLALNLHIVDKYCIGFLHSPVLLRAFGQRMLLRLARETVLGVLASVNGSAHLVVLGVQAGSNPRLLDHVARVLGLLVLNVLLELGVMDLHLVEG